MEIRKRYLFLALLVILTISFVANVNAQKITGELGNSRMVLRLEPNEEIRKSILVRNPNSFPFQIDMTASGDLAENLELEEESFELAGGEEKTAYFTIRAPNEAGTTETKINVRFSADEKNGIGLAASIVIIVSEDGEEIPEDNTENNFEELETENTEGEFSFGQNSGAVSENEKTEKERSFKLILGIGTMILAIILVGLVIYASQKKSNSKKRSGRPSA